MHSDLTLLEIFSLDMERYHTIFINKNDKERSIIIPEYDALFEVVTIKEKGT